MANNLKHNRAKQKIYLSGYSALLLLAISALALQGGFFTLVGLACWGITVFSCSYYLRRIKANSLKINPFHAEPANVEEEGRSYVLR
jgi:hypothetical protein